MNDEIDLEKYHLPDLEWLPPELKKLQDELSKWDCDNVFYRLNLNTE